MPIVATRTVSAILLAGLTLPLLAGCATHQSLVLDKEQMLVAAGFLEKPANTSERQAQLSSLPPDQLLRQQVPTGQGDSFGYIYADPEFCHCLLVGDAPAYQRFQQLALQARIADEERQAAELQQNAAFDWTMWGWAPGPVVVVPRHR